MDRTVVWEVKTAETKTAFRMRSGLSLRGWVCGRKGLRRACATAMHSNFYTPREKLRRRLKDHPGCR